jgi:hypothetical protein
MHGPQFRPDAGRERRQQPAHILLRQRLEDPGEPIMQHDLDGPGGIRGHAAVS